MKTRRLLTAIVVVGMFVGACVAEAATRRVVKPVARRAAADDIVNIAETPAGAALGSADALLKLAPPKQLSNFEAATALTQGLKAERRTALLKLVPQVETAGEEGYTMGSTGSAVHPLSGAGICLSPYLRPAFKVGPQIYGRLGLSFGQWPYVPMATQATGNFAYVRPGGLVCGEFYPCAETGWTSMSKTYMVRIYGYNLPSTVKLNGHPMALQTINAFCKGRIFSCGAPVLSIYFNAPSVTKLHYVHLRRM